MSTIATPAFFVAGAQKSGTTSLWAYLRQHPDLYLPEPKEPHFWCGPGDGTPPEWSGDGDEHLVRQFVWDPDHYSAIYQDGGHLLAGDCSTLYLVDPGVERRIAAARPDARVVALLRDPVQRAHSAWRMWRNSGLEDLTFSDALEIEDERIAAGWSPAYAYRANGLYATHVDRWLEVWPRDQLLLLRTDELAATPLETMRAVFEFLGVDPSFTPDVAERHNVRGDAVRSLRVAGMLRKRSRWKSLALRVVPPEVRQPAGRRLRSANTDRRAPDASTLADLRRFYSADLDRLESLTGWDLTSWRNGSS